MVAANQKLSMQLAGIPKEFGGGGGGRGGGDGGLGARQQTYLPAAEVGDADARRGHGAKSGGQLDSADGAGSDAYSEGVQELQNIVGAVTL